jgi:hypothetical protein
MMWMERNQVLTLGAGVFAALSASFTAVFSALMKKKRERC